MSGRSRIGIALFLSILIGLYWLNREVQILQIPWLLVGLATAYFVAPGGMIGFILSKGNNWSWIRFFATGLPISIAIIGILGLISRTIHLPIIFIDIFWLCLTICLVWYIVFKHFYLVANIQPNTRSNSLIILTIGTLVIVGIFAWISPITLKKVNDIMLYHAEVTYFASNQPLTWTEIYFNTGNIISDRFYLSYWTLAQALIVFVSGIHIFESQLTLQPLVIIYVASVVYTAGRWFGFSGQKSLLVVILQFLIFAVLKNEIGQELLERVIQDKVFAGIGLSLVVIASSYSITQNATFNRYLLFSLVWIGLLFTHPIIAGFVLGVLILWHGLNTIVTRQFKPYIPIVLLSLFIISPIVVLRVTTNSDDFYNFGTGVDDAPRWVQERLWISDDYQFYAPHPANIHFLTYVLLAVGLISSISTLRTNCVSRLYLAYIVVVAIGLIPFTAWIYGRLVSLSHINRVVWIFPYGFIMLSIVEWLLAKRLKLVQLILRYQILGVLAFVALSFISLSEQIVNRLWHETEQSHQITINRELLEIGDFFEQLTDKSIVVLGGTANRFLDSLPAVSTIIQPVALCDEVCMVAYTQIDPESADRRLRRAKGFFSSNHDKEKQLLNLDRYHVEYIVYENETNGNVVDDIMLAYPERFALVYMTDHLRVVQYLPSNK